MQTLQSLGRSGAQKVAEVLQNFLFWRGPLGGRAKASGPTPADGAILSDTWVNLTWSAGPFAVSQDVYLGDNFEDVTAGTGNTFRVNQPQSLSSFFVGLGMPGDPYPSGLVPGTTYYWRVDEVNSAAPNSPWKGNVWSFRVRPKTAHEPSPSDGAKYQDPGVTLTWTAGIGAKLHYVYLGDNFNDVNSATTGGTAVGTANHTSPTPLAKGKTYYWRVDEFDGAATYKGDVWSLTTLGDLPITDPNLVAWYKFETGEGTRVVDFSGHNNHGTIVPGTAGTVQWAEGLFNLGLDFLGDNQGHVDMPPGIVTTAQGSILMWINTTQGDAANNDEGMLWWASQTSAGDGYGGENEIHINIDDPGNGQLDFFLEQDVAGTSDITINGPDVGGTGWRHVAATWDLTDGVRLYVDGLEVGYAAHNTNIKSFAVMRLGRPVATSAGNCYYDGLMDDVRLFNYAISAAQISQIIAEGENPLQAGTANPSDGAQVAINLATPLNWSAGEKASQHDVYFGLDKAAVADANASDTAGVYRGRQSPTSYTPPEGVELSSGPYYWRIDEVNTDGTVTKGSLWSFSVADYVLVDDFEAYNEIQTGQPGSNMVYDTWPDGFTNPAANGSTMGYAVPFQPTMESAIVHGGGQSAPMMYNNTAAALSEVTRTFVAQNWTEHGVLTLSLWFYGDPANVAGQLYVKINTVKVAYDGEAVNLTRQQWQPWNIDLASVGTNLQSVISLTVGIEGAGAKGTLLLDDIRLYPYVRQLITPVQPDPAGLVAHYPMEGNANDIAGANNGTLSGGPLFTAGKIGQAISLDGTDDFVQIDSTFDLRVYSMALWFQIGGGTGARDLLSVYNSLVQHGVLLEMTGAGQLRFLHRFPLGSAGGTDIYSGTYSNGVWYHATIVKSADTMMLYVNGQQIGSAADNTQFDQTLPRLTLGALRHDTPSRYFPGALDEVQIFSRALSDAEVAGLAGRTLPFDKPF